MSDLDKDYESLAKDVASKIRSASELLVAASKICLENNLSIGLGDLDNLTQILNELKDKSDWDQNETDSWISSSNSC